MSSPEGTRAEGAEVPSQEMTGTPARRLLGVPRQRNRTEPAGDDTSAAPAGIGTLAFVESPAQLLNVLEWAHSAGGRPAGSTGSAGPAGSGGSTGSTRSAGLTGSAGAGRAGGEAGPDRWPEAAALTVVVLSPHDPMTRGQLRRMAELARDEGHTVRWEEARGGPTAPLRTIGGLTPLLRRSRRVVIGDPFSRYVQLLLTLTAARDLVVVDDGTATMEFVSQLACGGRLVRWHRHGSGRRPRDLVFAPFAATVRRRLTPPPEGGRRTVGLFSAMPVDEAPEGIRVTANEFAWTRRRFGPPRVMDAADIVGTSLVETGVVADDRYLAAVGALARTYGAARYFAHRRESTEKLRRLAHATGLEVVRPDLPLELIARRGPVGRLIVSFPSTVVHTLPLALLGTEVRVAVCDIDPEWLTDHASPRAQGFLDGVTSTARDVQRLPFVQRMATGRPPDEPSRKPVAKP